MKSIVSSRFRLLPFVLLSIFFLSLISSQAVQAIPTPATAPTAVTITIETFSGGPAESDGPDPSLTGESYTVSFTVRPAVSGITPYGTVVISDGDGNTCSKTATSGEAPNGYGWSCSLTSTNAGSKTLTATFTPADPAAFTGSTDTEPHEVYGARVAIETFSGGPTETDAPDPSTIGESYQVSFTVRPYGVSGITPYGTMVITDGDGNSCSKTASSGEAPNGYGWSCYITSTTAGPFKDLKSLRYGDRVTIESNGINYIYEVRESNLVSPTAVDSVFQSEERDWVTLITCEYYNPLSGEYTLRRVIRAVLVVIE